MVETIQVNAFAELNLSEALVNATRDLAYEKPSPIQQQTIPSLLQGQDLIGKSQTGSGKTAAFMLPILERLDSNQHVPQALIITPTRELAMQIEMHAKKLAKYMPDTRFVALCGGQDYYPQLKKLKSGIDVVVGTPGRVLDHIERGTLNLSSLKTFVLDEADEMLKMGFIEDVERILAELPEARQIALFSATMPSRIRQIAHQYLVEPVSVEIKQKTATVESIEQKFLFASPAEKPIALTRLLQVESSDGVIVFTRTKTGAEEVSNALSHQGLKVLCIHGDISQPLRERTIEKFKQGEVNILVATDVAARGLDVERVTHVINYDMPQDPETYVHRIGRTGRAGRSGVTILFVLPREGRMLNMIERHTKQAIKKILIPSDEMIQTARTEQFMNAIDERLARPELAEYLKLIQHYLQCERETEVSPEQVAAAIALQMNQDKPWQIERLATRKKREKTTFESSSKRFNQSEHKHHKSKTRARPKLGGQDSGYLEELFRLDVGKRHGVRAANIVGAIANEGGLKSRHITGLKIHDDHSFVRLPSGMPKEIYKDLKRAFVCGRPLNLVSMGTV